MKFGEQWIGSWNLWVEVSSFVSPWQYGFSEDSPLKICFPHLLNDKIRIQMTMDLHNCVIELPREMLYAFYRIICSAVLLYKYY